MEEELKKQIKNHLMEYAYFNDCGEYIVILDKNNLLDFFNADAIAINDFD